MREITRQKHKNTLIKPWKWLKRGYSRIALIIFLFETQIERTDKFSEEAVCEFVAIYAKQIVDIANKYIKRANNRESEGNHDI